MRTTPLSFWSNRPTSSVHVGHTVFHCLGLKPTPEAYDQASVGTNIGGLGIRRIVDHAKGAFTASWHEGQGITKESWTNVFLESDCSTVYDPQQKASAKTDAALMNKLKEAEMLSG